MSLKAFFHIPSDDQELSEKIKKLLADLGHEAVYLMYLSAEAEKRGLIS